MKDPSSLNKITLRRWFCVFLSQKITFWCGDELKGELYGSCAKVCGGIACIPQIKMQQKDFQKPKQARLRWKCAKESHYSSCFSCIVLHDFSQKLKTLLLCPFDDRLIRALTTHIFNFISFWQTANESQKASKLQLS